MWFGRLSRAAAVVVVAVGVALPSFGQDLPAQQGASKAPNVGPEVRRAPVVIDGEELFTVRGVSAYPAERRAADIAARIRELAKHSDLDQASLTLESDERTTAIVGKGQRIVIVHDEDADLEDVDRLVLAEAVRLKIWQAVVAYRAARQPALLLRHALYTLGATLLLVGVAYVWRRVIGWLRGRLERRYGERVRDVEIQSFKLVRAEQLWWLLSGVLGVTWVVTVVALLLAYLRFTLALFPWTRGAAGEIVNLVVDPLRNMGRGFVATIPDLVFLAILFVVTRYLLKLVRLFFDSIATGTVRLRNFEAEWAEPTYKLVRLLVIAFAIVVAYPYIPGSGTDAFKGVSLFIGVVFSLGSSSLIGNVLSGFSMTYRRTFRLGDLVKIGDHLGFVKDTRLLVTHLRTPKNEEVIVPNSTIVNHEVVNYSALARDGGLILHTTVGIGYETPWRQVEAMLLEAAARTPGVLREPPPFVHQLGLGDFAVTYEINVYCDRPDRMRLLYTELHRHILDVFNEYGVQIMTPAYEGDPEQPKVVPKAEWYTAPARLPTGSGGGISVAPSDPTSVA